MIRAFEIYQRDGLFPIISVVKSRIYSKFIQIKYRYAHTPLIDSSSSWITGSYASIGKDLRIGGRCRIETIDFHNGIRYHPRLIIGDYVSINDDVHIGCADLVEIGDNVLMAGKIYISDHNHGTYKGDKQSPSLQPPSARPLGYAPVKIGDNVWIGEMVSVLPGTTIGEGSIIGANSVVSRDIPPHTIAVGIPAKPIKKFDFASQTWRPIE